MDPGVYRKPTLSRVSVSERDRRVSRGEPRLLEGAAAALIEAAPKLRARDEH
jgi:hypothetical protein